MERPSFDSLSQHLAALQRAALAAADPAAALQRHLRTEADTIVVGQRRIRLKSGRLLIIALGKASVAMARAAVERCPRPSAVLVAFPRIEPAPADLPAGSLLFPAGHPLPDEGSLAAGRGVIDMLRGASPDDVVLVLVSGGGSALLEALPEGLGLAQVSELTRALQHAGADIHELNTVRRSVSLLKGGGLARLAHPARVISFLLSDVPGDDPATIASGPTVPSPTGPAEAREVMTRYGLRERFPEVWNALERDRIGEAKMLAGHQVESGPGGRQIESDPGGRRIESTPGDRRPESTSVGRRVEKRPGRHSWPHHVLIGSNAGSALAVRDEARKLGFHVQIASLSLEGEARTAGRFIAGMARSVRVHRQPVAPPACLIFGGETTVTVVGTGRGGRNQELALGAARALEGAARTAILALATDGVDGPTDAAGAWITGETAAQARALGLSIDHALADNDAYPLLDRLGALWKTGPTGTNVMDLAIALIY